MGNNIFFFAFWNRPNFSPQFTWKKSLYAYVCLNILKNIIFQQLSFLIVLHEKA